MVWVSPYLFCKQDGGGYFNEETGESEAFKSLWQRFMKRVMKETNVQERFHEHDLRAKAASDAENVERARQLLQHFDSKITRRTYIRKPESVMPNTKIYDAEGDL